MKRALIWSIGAVLLLGAAGLALVIAEPMRARFQQELDVTTVSHGLYK
jgi:hypothetical protein